MKKLIPLILALGLTFGGCSTFKYRGYHHSGFIGNEKVCFYRGFGYNGLEITKEDETIITYR